MVMPYAHLDRLAQLPAEAAHELMDLAQRTEQALEGLYHPQGYNFGLNLGQSRRRGGGRASASARHAALAGRYEFHDHSRRDAHSAGGFGDHLEEDAGGVWGAGPHLDRIWDVSSLEAH